LTTTLKEEAREVDHRSGGRINSTNPEEIGTGQKANILQLMMRRRNR
jgi:hypothetical protein